ncbi:hypothetical protein [Gracilibacillus massiliensis]|uniref:hypothetical protein n=1 Tax=Gracilibacillus massiliensis TaxID=1564956 RepID=UPI00071C3C02|nr:hypothetical protein [Gracilibacillus massiliensis]
MKRKIQYLFLFSFLLLVGCEVTLLFDEPANEDPLIEVENAGDVEEENIGNREIKADNKLGGEGQVVSETTETNLVENDQANDQSEGVLDVATVKKIMETYGSMYINSMKLDANIEAVQTNIYQKSPLTWDLEIYINQSSKITTHEQIVMGDGRSDDVFVEVYSHPDVSFMNIAETDEWLEDENRLGGYRHYYWINSEVMNHFAEHSDLFVGYDDDTHFRIEFFGTDEQFEELIFFGFETIVDDTLNNYFVSEGGNISGELIMKFEKESYTLTDYTLSYEATTTVPDEGDYQVKESGEYRFSDFGDHNSLTIPSFVYQ